MPRPSARLVVLAAAWCVLAVQTGSAAPLRVQAQDPLARAPVSQCLAMASAPQPPYRAPVVMAATGALSPHDVRITYVGHSTFRIESGGGVTIATDYNGYAGIEGVPRVVTMNHAHSSHYTAFPDPEIEYVLRGWNPDGGAAKHRLVVDDVLIRNVPTDIRNDFGIMEVDGNSIFIFEIAGLCLGHLGHLHHRLTDAHYAMIGRLDVLFVPVDGTYTMGHAGMIDIAKRVRASLLIPMHAFGPGRLSQFVSAMGEVFDVELSQTPTITISQNTLPQLPKVLVLPGY
ncbi:MBL fold metallo-hydrolase [Breoghania sp. L-A4]|uniref:MBL fold metallo-hydrolase n=1 Tax=Breoghania sp. L-A4 TaxID=2304600 RepID=UPI000E35D8DC|nr:MBL fold metallo-hydrolase [Breoghania sp. L-A4]AXS39190.1 Zn-dependent hydrolase [Breoghania sp. L-A4]